MYHVTCIMYGLLTFSVIVAAMLSRPSKLPASQLPRTRLINFCYPVEQTTYPASIGYAVKKFSPCISVGIGLFSSLKRQWSYRSTKKVIYLCHTPHVVESCKEQLKYDIVGVPNLTENVLVHSRFKLLGSADNGEIPLKKIDHGNKGRVPWNKGLRHNQETCARIRLRTKEALRDPKVRKKMADAPRSLSIQTKARIRKSLANLWGKRLIWKRPREKFLQSWAGSIAEAARTGGSDQEELEWDSYEILIKEMSLLQIQLDAEVKAIEMACRRTERAADANAKRMARLAQKRGGRREMTKATGESIKKKKKSKEDEKEKLAELQEMKLKERLMRIHRKKSRINQVSCQRHRPWENFDMELVKEERLQNEISLADQIRVAKNKQAEQILRQRFLDSC